MKKNPVLVFWSAISLLAIINLAVFDLIILFAPANLRVQFVPDDAFYYLQLAKNYVRLGYWTFDSGLSPASGFHPLLAYLLALIYKIFHPGTEAFVGMDVALSSLPTILLASLVWIWSVAKQNTVYLIFLTLCIGARTFLFNSVSGVEWPLVILLTCLYCVLFYKAKASPKGLAGIFLTGLFLSLARTDTGLFPFAIFLAVLILSILRLSHDRSALKISLAGLAGAITGLGLAFFNTYLFTGNLIQSSARMKYYWSTLGGSPLDISLTLPLKGIGFDYFFDQRDKLVYWIPFLLLYMLLFLIVLRQRSHPLKRSAVQKDEQTFKRVALLIASLLCIVGYTILYTSDGVIQNWYTANFLIPLFLLGTSLAGYLAKLGTGRIHWGIIFFSSVALIALFFNLLSTYPLDTNSPWPHQQALLEAGKYLNAHPLDGRVAAWNAGVLGYYQGGQVVNIDGLVNDDIYPYAVSNNLPAYLEEKNIRYVVDFQMLFSTWFQRRGGYADPAFLAKLQPLMTFDEGQYPPWQFLTIYKIDH